MTQTLKRTLSAATILMIAVWAIASMTACSPGASPSPASVGVTPGAEWHQLYFTAPKYPDEPAEHRGSLDEKLTQFINTAQKSVDMAIYQLDLPNVTQALLDAKTRGASVRVVTDVDILQDSKESPSFRRLQEWGIPVAGGNPGAIMHDKFVVVDQAAVWTGSWNFTENDTNRYNNNGILMRSPELAHNYTVTFEKMFTGKSFGASRKPGGTAPILQIGGVRVENYFAPEDKVAGKVIAHLQSAARTIDFMAYSFTHDEIGKTVMERAGSGVRVRGVFEKTGSGTPFSEYARMKEARMDVWQDGNPYLMHHKVLIIDGKTVIFGSFNFSQNADEDNDENILIIEDNLLASEFEGEFELVYKQANKTAN